MQRESEIRVAYFNRCFEEANAFRGRYRVLMGGAGSGKSVNVAQDYLLRLMNPRYSGANLLVVRKTEKSHRASTFAELCAAAQRIFGENWNRYFRVLHDPMRLVCLTNGNEIMFRGMKSAIQREQLKSIQATQGKLCWIWCEEASELSMADVELLDDRLRGILPFPLYYQMTFTFNPVSARHWLKGRFFDQVHPDAYIHQSTFLDNRFIDEAYIKRMRQRERDDPEGYRVYGMGEWGETKGIILPHFSVRDFDRNLQSFDTVAMGTDFGFNHAHATLLVGYRDGNVYILSEWVASEKDMSEICTMLRRNFPMQVLMWCDCAEPDRIEALRKAGFWARAVKKEPGSVLAQIDWLKARRLIVHPSCERTIAELQSWCWKFDASSNTYLDEPVNVFDDAIAALRYGIEGWRRGSAVSFQ